MDQELVCRNCSHPEIEPHYKTPLCSGCRTTLVQRPVPVWITATGIAVVGLMAISFTKFPIALRAGLAEERGHRAEAAGNYPAAERNYAIAAKQYPESLKTRGRLAVCAYHAGDYGETASVLDSLSGQSLDKDEADELNALGDELSAKLKQKERAQ